MYLEFTIYCPDETKELLQDFQELDAVTYLVYDRKMKFLLSENVIA